MRPHLSFLFDEIITCGAVLSGFELCQALRRLGVQCDIVSTHRNQELEQYFAIQPVAEASGITVTFTPKKIGEWAYVRTKDERWKSHKEKKIAVSQWIADWIGTDIVIGNGTHERFYDMGLERDIDVLICGNYEPNKNIESTVEYAKRLGQNVVWFGRQARAFDGVRSISRPAISDVPRLYNRAKTFLSMSKEEGWGRPVAEAMACGVPKIINENGGNREIEVVPWDQIAKKIITKLC